MFKVIFSILSVIFSIYCFMPYIRDIFKGETKPHIYSWLIWTILQSSAAIIMFMNGGGLGVFSISIGAILCLYICILALKHGTKNIKKIDIFCLIASLIMIVVWIFTKNALLSVILISVIDFIGFFPTMRKSYEEPNTETAATYIFSVISVGFAILAIGVYSLTTVLYLVSIFITNSICASIILIRRKQLI